MPVLRIGYSLWDPIPVCISGFAHFYLRTCVPLPHSLLLLLGLPELPGQRQALEQLYPRNDPIVHQWSGRECWRRPDIFAECNSPTCKTNGCREYRSAERGAARGTWRTSQYFISRSTGMPRCVAEAIP